MPGIELVRSFLQQANAQGSRSTALSPLGWLTAILVSALVGVLWRGAPHWVVVAILSGLGVSVGMYLFAYVYFMVKQPDALRSEKFTLSKLAIEKSVMGDNIIGLINSDSGADQRAIKDVTPKGGE